MTRKQEHIELLKAADQVLFDFAKNFARLESEGEWWGHDTNLGSLAEEFDLARKEILRIVDMGKLHEIKRFNVGGNVNYLGRKKLLNRLRRTANETSKETNETDS